MLKIQQDVKDFMVAAGQDTPHKPTHLDESATKLRIKLIQEELEEFVEALGGPEGRGTRDMVEAYDAILDLLYVVTGAAVAMGLDLEEGWKEVHATNMAKFGPGSYRREDGKQMKPPGWAPPNLKHIVEKQSSKGCCRDTDGDGDCPTHPCGCPRD